MLSLRVPDGEGVKLTGLYINRNGHLVPAEVIIVGAEGQRIHFYAEKAVLIDRMGQVDEAELIYKGHMQREGHHG